MAVKTLAQVATLLEKQINVIKYTIHCITIIEWILGGFLLAMAIGVRWNLELQETMEALSTEEFYIGIYILIFTGFVMLLLPVLSCASVYQEITQLLLLNIAGHGCSFFLLMLGSGFLMQNSSENSGVQYSIRNSMHYLISNSYDDRISDRLSWLQEKIGCCGADGPNDYIILRRPTPSECTDSVTGNAFAYGCSQVIIWYLSEEILWPTGIAFALGFLQLLVAVLSYILIQALQKEEKLTYRR